ncbi:MAG TPA: hypothetical protein PLW32_09180 [Chitinophagaceae bacterium]|nr:hypothetical protein [Chitinophagaceae bacterium]
METKDNFSPQESLAMIEGMINKAKNNFTDDSFLYLLWGWVVFICSIGHFIMLKFTTWQHAEMIWMLTWVTVAIQIIYLVKKQKKERVKTYTDEIISYLWVTFGISMFMVSVIIARANTWVIMYPIVLMLYGIPTFLTGIIMRFTPLKIGGIVCWVLSIIATLIAPIYVLLLLAIAMLAAWIIPGYLLRAMFKKQTA